jgi:prepilin-type N-terminal cleavage/methylation domain-containing protein
MIRRGFTIVEMLVVIAIVLALLGIVVVAVGPATQTANKVATQNFLASVSAATTGFQRDHGFYPDSNYTTGPLSGWYGAEIIAQALVGYLPAANDGVTGLGAKQFKSTHTYATTGRNYGPYLEVKSGRTLPESLNGTSSHNPKRFYLAMASSSNAAPILYFRKQIPTSSMPDTWGTSSSSARYNINHNYSASFKIGHTDRAFEYYEALDELTDKTRQSFETAARAAEFLLIAAGSDEQFGTAGNDGILGNADDLPYDDVTATGP